MATLNISMPDEMRAFIQTHVRNLIRHDHKETEKLLMEGIDSGPAKPLDMAALQQKAQSLLRQQKSS